MNPRSLERLLGRRQPIVERNVDEARKLVIQTGHVALEVFITRQGQEVPIVTQQIKGGEYE